MHRKIKQYINKYADLGYGEDHLLFAAHAAFPTGVTPHLLYQLWANFSVIPGREEVLDYVVVSDFLLSNLCRETSLGIFEINGRIRTELLAILEEDPRFGPKRLKELAYFLYQYIQKGNQEEDFAVFREAQYWTALSVIAPQKAASEIGQILSDKIKASDPGEILRISSLLEQIGQKNQSFDNLVNYAQGLKDGLLDRPQAAQQAFNKVMVIGPEDPDQETFSLKIPLMSSVVNPSTNFQKAPSAAERIALERIAEASEQLDLSGIPGLKKIPEAVRTLDNLRELVANNSDLEEVPAFLEEMKNLEIVMLGHNQIRHLPASFSQGLKYLDFRYNQLTSIDRSVFLLEDLEHLNLESNELQIMPGTVINATDASLSVLETRNNPWLNLPVDFDFPGTMDLLLERWQRTYSTIETIQLIDLGAQQGELYLDIQDGFRPWMASGALNVALSVVQQRFALYPVQDRFESPEYPSLRVLYLTGENFELINDSNGEERSILSPEQLVQLWQPFKEVANLIILNIGESIPYAQALVNDGFKAVIAADFPLSESQRFYFQDQFFQTLQAGDDLRAAYDIAATGGPLQKGNFAQQSKVQQSSFSEGPDLSIELNSWRIIENTEREIRTDWEWKLPDLAEAEAEAEAEADTAENTENLEPVDIEEHKQVLLKLTSEDNISAVFEYLQNEMNIDNANLKDEILLLRNRNRRITESEMKGLLGSNTLNVSNNRFRQAIIDLITGLSEKDITEKAEGSSLHPELLNLKEQFNQFIASHNLNEYFNLFEDRVKPESKHFERRIQYERRYRNIQSEERMGTTAFDDLDVQMNNLVLNLIQLTQSLALIDIRLDSKKENNDVVDPQLEDWKTDTKSLLTNVLVTETLEQIEPKIRFGTLKYDDLVNISSFFYRKEKAYMQGVLNEEAFDLSRNQILNQLLDLVESIKSEDFQANPVEISQDPLAQLQFSLKTNLRQYQMDTFLETFQSRLKPGLLNYDGFLLAGRFYFNRKNEIQGIFSNEESDLNFRRNIAAFCSYITQLELPQLNPENLSRSAFANAQDLFLAHILKLLAANDVEKALFYFNDYTSGNSDFVARFNLWLASYDGNEKALTNGTISMDGYQKRLNQSLQDFKVFLEDIARGDFLIEDFLPQRANDLQEEINALNAQKAFDERQMDALQEELRLIQEMDRPQKGLEWPQVRTLYSLIADNEVLTAAEIFFKDAYVIDEKLAQQGQQIYDSLNQLERDREKIGFNDYQKEFNRLVEGLMITINDLWRDRPEEYVDDPDLIQYLRATAERQIEAGQLKQAFGYLLNSLDPASSLMEDTIELSAKYYFLEAAQYQENIDYKGVLDQLNSTTRYLRNIIQSEALHLQSNFVADELERVEQALKLLSEKGKSKKFNIRDDGDYQELVVARDFLQKFLPA